MAKRRTIKNDDVDAVVCIITSFRKKPTWDVITQRAQEAGMPFQKRALQGHEHIKAAYDAKLANFRLRREHRIKQRAKAGLPRSESDLSEMIAQYQQSIKQLETELRQRNLELAFMTQQCRRGNIELSEVRRPLKLPQKD